MKRFTDYLEMIQEGKNNNEDLLNFKDLYEEIEHYEDQLSLSSANQSAKTKLKELYGKLDKQLNEQARELGKTFEIKIWETTGTEAEDWDTVHIGSVGGFLTVLFRLAWFKKISKTSKIFLPPKGVWTGLLNNNAYDGTTPRANTKAEFAKAFEITWKEVSEIVKKLTPADLKKMYMININTGKMETPSDRA